MATQLTEPQRQAIERHLRQRIAKVRVPQPRRTPQWLKDRWAARREADYAHARRTVNAPVWSVFGDELTSARLITRLASYGGVRAIPGWSEHRHQQAIGFWQSWQNPKSGRFEDPDNLDRVVNEKYVVGMLKALGAQPRYPWTTTSVSGTIQTETFLERTKDDPDWAQGGWGVGSHTGYMAMELWTAINDGRTELIPALEEGIQNILSHQDPTSGMWGLPTAALAGQIGGALKVIGRLYWGTGLKLPHTTALADALIRHQTNGDWLRQGSAIVLRNVNEMLGYCLDASAYRRGDLLNALEGNAEDFRQTDGAIDGIDYCGLYLYWEDYPFAGNSLTRHFGTWWFSCKYKVHREESGRIKITAKPPDEFVWHAAGSPRDTSGTIP